MEPESSLPHSQMPATCPYPKPIIIIIIIRRLRRFSDHGVLVGGVSRKHIYYDELSQNPTPNPQHGGPWYLFVRHLFQNCTARVGFQTPAHLTIHVTE